jgi:hypothetical protein
MGDRRGVYRVLLRRPEGTKNLRYPGVDGRIILKLIFMKGDEEAWAGLIWLRIGTGGERCEWDKNPSGSTKCWVFFD